MILLIKINNVTFNKKILIKETDNNPISLKKIYHVKNYSQISTIFSTKLNSEQLAVLTGGLLGDLAFRFSGQNWKIESGTQKDKIWLFKQYEIFYNLIQTPPRSTLDGKMENELLGL